jgi:hypothetical protein
MYCGKVLVKEDDLKQCFAYRKMISMDVDVAPRTEELQRI